MDLELSRKLAERKQMEKKVDGGGDIIEMHRHLEEDVDESGNEQNNVPDSNNVEKQQESAKLHMSLSRHLQNGVPMSPSSETCHILVTCRHVVAT